MSIGSCQEQRPELLADRRPARLARHHHLAPAVTRSRSASQCRCVLLPAPSMPSRVMNFRA